MSNYTAATIKVRNLIVTVHEVDDTGEGPGVTVGVYDANDREAIKDPDVAAASVIDYMNVPFNIDGVEVPVSTETPLVDGFPLVSGVPERIKEAIDRHVEFGTPTGGFVQACLENDLKEAFGRADVECRAAMFHIVGYLYSEIPSSAWGTEKMVCDWQRAKASVSEGSDVD